MRIQVFKIQLPEEGTSVVKQMNVFMNPFNDNLQPVSKFTSIPFIKILLLNLKCVDLSSDHR